MEKSTLENLEIYGAKIKKVIETDKLYLLYSVLGRINGTESWFNNREIDFNWKDKICSSNLKYAQELGFKFTPEEIEILKREGYNILSFDKE